IPTLVVDLAVEKRQKQRIEEFRSRRDDRRFQVAMAGVRSAAAGTDNLMEVVIEAARAGATLGEVSDCFREVLGIYRESAAAC
ncbi:MAG: methylmalonyl-CoA mutase, partial [Deltaproteobacteria bacterium]|nr:methylmalonyl-CoA mutase [Deltaproteobacteria bacterium]